MMSKNKDSENKDVFAEIKVQDPNSVKVTLSVTMAMADWVRLKDKLPNTQTYPIPKFNKAIDQVISKAKNRWDYDSRFDIDMSEKQDSK